MEADLTVGPVVRVEPVVLAVGAGHRLAQRKTVSYEDLADEIVIGGAKPDYWREALVPSHTPSGRPIHVGPTVTAESELLPILSNGEAVARSCTPTPADTTPGPTSPPCPSMTPLQRGGRCCGEPPPKPT